MAKALKSETNVPVGSKRTQVWQRSLRQAGRAVIVVHRKTACAP